MLVKGSEEFYRYHIAHLYGSITNAIASIEGCNYGAARHFLIAAQNWAKNAKLLDPRPKAGTAEPKKRGTDLQSRVPCSASNQSTSA